jgi:3-oxoacyl-[acyl-carrier-protein] synthase-3
LGAYLPERVMENDEWAALVDTSDEWIRKRTGILRRRVAAADESTADLATAAASTALTDAGLTAADLDEIIVATDTPEVFIPDTAAFLQARLGAPEITAYDLGSSGCAGFVLALDVAKARAMTGNRTVLVVGVELLTRLMSWQDRNTCVLFGDAAGAAVVGRRSDAAEILAANAGTDGTRSDILGLEVGGTRAPFSEERARRGQHTNLVMHGREVFREAVARMTASSRRVLDEAGVSVAELALIVPHQANLRILNQVRDRLGADPDQLFVNVQEYGNTGSASVPVALWEAREAGRISRGDLVLLTAFGAGFHWASMLLRF